MLVHLLDASAGPGRTPLRDYEAINRELRLYDPALAQRPQIVALNKIDIPEVRRQRARIAVPFERRGLALHGVSAATGEGVPELLEAAWKVLAAARDEDAREAARASHAGAARPANR